MKTFKVKVYRTVCVSNTYTVTAESSDEAEERADDEARDECWNMNGHEAEYETEVIGEE